MSSCVGGEPEIDILSHRSEASGATGVPHVIVAPGATGPRGLPMGRTAVTLSESSNSPRQNPMNVDPDQPQQLYARFPRRLKAAVLDSVILAAMMLAGMELLALIQPSFEGAHGFLIALFAALLFYEPVLISLHGRTLGHRALNLHVVADTPSGKLPLWRAFLRSTLKLLTGVSVFATMPFTRRSQALHDLAFGTTVCIFDRRRAGPEQFVIERIPSPSQGSMPSWWRRLLVSLGYLLLLVVALGIGAAATQSDECLELERCNATERLLEQVLASLWLAGSFVSVVLVWQGRMPGARRRPSPAQPAFPLTSSNE